MTGRKRHFDIVLTPMMRSAAMQALDRQVRAVAPKDVGITLIGESGTGKEILARRIHDLSARRGGPFVPINCAAVPEQLFESELFGHERGAFTGATERALGKLEAADHGTLFLDEIGEMPFSLQAKLLRFLENRKFMRVGSARKITIDCRLICATLRPLEDDVRAGRFRADLFYRIQGITLRIPPLRERPLDLAPLVAEFAREFSAKHDVKPVRVGRQAMAVLRAYSWPGNVRELRNVVERVTLLGKGRNVRVQDLPEAIRQAGETPAESAHEARDAPSSLRISIDDSLELSVQRIIDAALLAENGNRSRAARRLGIGLRTVQRHVSGTRREPRAR